MTWQGHDLEVFCNKQKTLVLRVLLQWQDIQTDTVINTIMRSIQSESSPRDKARIHYVLKCNQKKEIHKMKPYRRIIDLTVITAITAIFEISDFS